MKKLFVFCAVAILAVGHASAQKVTDQRRGYIGITLGPAFPLGDVSSKDISGGAQINLVNFGYVFGKHVGVAATWFGNAFVSKANEDNMIGLGGIMAGPLFSMQSKSGKFDFDVKPLIGFGRGSTIVNNDVTDTSSAAFAFGLGAASRWNCGKRISVSLGADYYNCKPDKHDMSSLAVVLGVNYRLK